MYVTCLGDDAMFDPNDWTRKPSTNEDTRMIYINKDTSLPKLRETFSREQQRMLDNHEVTKRYEIRRKQ
jgi:hypothetical protein